MNSPKNVKMALGAMIILLVLICSPGFSQTPTVTVRYGNPMYNCVTEQFCVDVEVKSSLPNIQVFGMNVRFFYDDSVLELVGFTDFQGGYSAVAPNPPTINTSGPAGPALFGFAGAAEFVNGAIQLTNLSAPPIILSTTTWSKIFKVCFNIDTPNPNENSFCPSIVWDLEQNPANGGFLPGDDGLVVTVVDPDPNIESAPANENVNQFNWNYIGNGAPPYGQPAANNCISLVCEGTICGNIEDDLGQLIEGVDVKLIKDVNNNQIYDTGDIIVQVVTTDEDGEYCFPDVLPINYILLELQPITYGNSSDYDHSPDPDGNDSGQGPDNEIPVSLSPDEMDTDNKFIDIVCPTQFPSVPNDTICPGQTVSFLASDLNLGNLTYTWNFGSGASPATGVGLGTHNVSYVTTTNNQMNNGAVVTMSISKTGCATLTGPVSTVKINPKPNTAITGTTTALCYYTNRKFKPVAPVIPGATYLWNFGEGAVPATANVYEPDSVKYLTTGTKIIKLKIFPNSPGAQCPDSSATNLTVNACPGFITGTVKSVLGPGIGGVQLKLYPDADQNGVADTTAWVKFATTVGSGSYSMPSVHPGDYVLIETQPNGWNSYDDGDMSLVPDGDNVPNTDSLDNLIPVTIVPNKVDADNNFTELPLSGSITGNVFFDTNGNELPDPGEGIPGIELRLHSDTDKNGHADNPSPVATQLTNAAGEYSFPIVLIGNYVLVEDTPDEYDNVKDYDYSEDMDTVPNSDLNNDTIPVSIGNGELDDFNYFIDEGGCTRVVSNLNDHGFGSLRGAIECANSGDTVVFHPSLSGQTIIIDSSRIEISKSLVIYSSSPDVTIKSTVPGLIDIISNVTVQFKELKLISGIAGHPAAAFYNFGHLILNKVNLLRNPDLPSGNYLIRNTPGSQLELRSTNNIEWD